jgi:hypothetical protein
MISAASVTYIDNLAALLQIAQTQLLQRRYYQASRTSPVTVVDIGNRSWRRPVHPRRSRK